MGKSATVLDESMIGKNHLNTLKEVEMSAIDQSPENQRKGGEKGFEDVTDLKNEDFVFVY